MCIYIHILYVWYIHKFLNIHTYILQIYMYYVCMACYQALTKGIAPSPPVEFEKINTYIKIIMNSLCMEFDNLWFKYVCVFYKNRSKDIFKRYLIWNVHEVLQIFVSDQEIAKESFEKPPSQISTILFILFLFLRGGGVPGGHFNSLQEFQSVVLYFKILASLHLLS